MTTNLSIRALRASDYDAWRRLWTAYLDFYGTSVSEAVVETTFARLLGEEAGDHSGLLAVGGDAPVGLVHYLFHRHAWRIENVCYLQDLYVEPAARGMRVGRRLMEAVYAAADAAGAASVYWLTQEYNYAGRQLYDRVGVKTDFIKYQRA